MTWTDHWSILLSGAAASVIGLVGLFVVFWLTTRHDRTLERERRLSDRLKQREAEQDAAVARVYGALVMQPKDLTFAPIYGNAQALELLAACVHFQAVVGGQHPDVARWVLERHAELLRARKSYWRVCAFPSFAIVPRQPGGRPLEPWAGPSLTGRRAG